MSLQVETINGVSHTTSYTYDQHNRLASKTTDGITVEYAYDDFGRTVTQTTKNGNTTVLTESYTYKANSSQIHTYRTVSPQYDVTYTYTYDDNGNILSVNDGTNTTSYVYDTQNQLIRENNQAGGFTHAWTYDNAGNIQNRTEYAYTTGDVGTATDTISYGYTDTNWKDKLTAYDGTAITYDEIGNPLSYRGKTLTWEHGRELATLSDGNVTWTYTYDANGMRTGRVCSNTYSYEYIYNGSQLIQMNSSSGKFYFTYDADGTPLTVTWGVSTYTYITNLQGDVIGLLNSSGKQVVTYSYDAWGNCDASATDPIIMYNPLRYRGYVYDKETGLYYLQSRYYDPTVGRFINADDVAYLGADGSLTSYNLFAYCNNAPINNSDPCGTCVHRLDFWNDCEMCIMLSQLARAALTALATTAKKVGSSIKTAVVSTAKQVAETAETVAKTITNTDETNVIEAEHLAFYNGVAVVKVPFMDTSAFSCGIILMGSNVRDEKLVQHEYGHVVHLRMIGLKNYVTKVAIPSVTSFWINPNNEDYFNQPWEYIADRFGGVNADLRNYKPNANLKAALYYLYTVY